MAPRKKIPQMSDNIAELLGIPQKRPATQDEKDKLTAEFNAFIEYYWNQMNRAPSMERLKTEFQQMSEAAIKASLKIALLKLQAKGYGILTRTYLSPEQIAVANSMCNMADRRSNKKKLDDFGISPATYANWCKDPTYANYIREQTEKLLGNSIGMVHLALIEAATQGDVSAMKLFYEITGRHTQGQQQTINVQQALVQVIESVQKHVHDPKLLQAIANDIQTTGGVLQGELLKGGED